MDQTSETENPPPGGNFDDPTGTVEAGLSCNCCRRRKLRCSREVPSCQQCRKTGNDCVYETKRSKPGVKAGAIDNLHRRLDALESLVHQGSSPRADHAESQVPISRDGHDADPYSILSFFAREFERFNNAQNPFSNPPNRPPCNSESSRPTKRRRLDDFLQNDPGDHGHILPDSDELEQLLQAYFFHVHPWIPMLHEGRLRRKLSSEQENRKLRVVVRAIVLVAGRYISGEHSPGTFAQLESKTERLRDDVVAIAMRDLSVENLQALIIIAFNDIGRGRNFQAWPIVGALSRGVEYLQLAVEADETERLALSQPYAPLVPPSDWTEAEERRRVFWNVFNLDRFCSVTMGWNTSLTSDDVNRRLPCDGLKWRKEDEVTTPYFGIWDKASGRIGNPITLGPPQYQGQPSQRQAFDENSPSSNAGTSPEISSAHVNMSSVGAFAYSIEATESLSRVTTYFLQQKVNFSDSRDVSSWLTRFKELDLRLVHWKMLLPQKWQVDTTSRHSSRMDPNLTLAHITHNTSMILLHQPIAFPLPEWPFKNRLPSVCSAETCQTAAAEIASITENYLRNAPPTVPAASQLAFCLYVAARVCLLRWKRYDPDGPLDPSFWAIVESLDTMSRRWNGPHAVDSSLLQENLASKYSGRLKELYKLCSENAYFDLDVLGYTGGTVTVSSIISPTAETDQLQTLDTDRRSQNLAGASPLNFLHSQARCTNKKQPVRTRVPPSHSSPNISDDIAQSSFQRHKIPNPRTPTTPAIDSSSLEQIELQENAYHSGGVPSGDLGAISQLLLDQQFSGMDRIISYDDGVFGSVYDGTGSW